MLNPAVSARAADLAAHFQRHDPFRHVVIDDFFDPASCAHLLEEFPPFERGNARNEAGELGNKSTIEKIRRIRPTYAALDDTIKTRGFLDLIGRITGIPERCTILGTSAAARARIATARTSTRMWISTAIRSNTGTGA